MMALGIPVRWGRAMAVLALCGALAGCFQRPAAPLVRFEPEAFSAAAGFSRFYETSPALACEAARRTLLSQGYVISSASDEQVTGRKFFQPSAEAHVPLEMRVVCATEAGDAAVVFAVAVQELHAVRKASESASLGVGGLGWVAVAVEGSNDGMVKVGTQTISDPHFYRSFFDLLGEHLAQ